MARVLVTGGAGFVGLHVAAALAGAGHEVVVLDARPAPPGARAHLGDVRDPRAVAAALVGVDAVSHQAATVGMGVDLADLPRYASTNDLGTAVLLAGMHAAGVRHLVLASSMVVYGEGAYRCPEHGPVPAGARREADLAAGRFEPPCPRCGAALAPGQVREDAALDPRSTYAATKAAQEHLASAWAHQGGGTAALLRYHNVYGRGLPRDTPYAGVAAIFRSAALAGRAPEVFEDGGQRRDFVHVTDVARANLAAVEDLLDRAPQRGDGRARAYNVASGSPRTVLDLAAGLAAALGAPPPRVSGRYRAGDVRHVTASSERLRTELRWEPRVSFDEGVRDLAEEATSG